MDHVSVHFRFGAACQKVVAFIKKAKTFLGFERKLSRRTQIILAILFFAMWLTTPGHVKILVVSAKCINYGLGLLLHGLVLYRKGKPYMGITLHFGRTLTIALGAVLVFIGLMLRGVIDGVHFPCVSAQS
jgi:hypothetical protein